MPLTRGRRTLWLAAEGISLAGDNVFYIVLSWTVVSTHGAGGLGWVLTAGALPRGLLMLLGGAIVDRLGPLRLAICSDIGRTIVLGAMAAAVWTVGTPFALLITLAALFGIADALYYPASGALPSLLLPPDQVVRIQNVRNLLNRIAMVAGASTGGILVAWTGPALPFLADAATFLLCAAALTVCRASARPTPPQQGAIASLLTDLRSGFSYIAGCPELAMPLIAAGLFEFAINGVINVGFPAIADFSGWGSAGFGLLSAGMGLGAGASALLFSLAPRLAVPTRVYVLSGAIASTALLTVAGADRLTTAVAASATLGCVAGAVAGVIFPQLQRGTDPSHIGRVMSMFYFLTAGLAPLSLAAIAALIEATGPKTTLACAAVAAAAAAAIGYLGSRQAPSQEEGVRS